MNKAGLALQALQALQVQTGTRVFSVFSKVIVACTGKIPPEQIPTDVTDVTSGIEATATGTSQFV
jgi:hypothetical protein